MANLKYKKGDLSEDGRTIDLVVASYMGSTVFITTDGGIGYEFLSPPAHLSQVLIKYDELRLCISDDLPEAIKRNLKCSLAACLFHAASAESQEKALNSFKSFESIIQKTLTPNQAKLALIRYNVIASFSLMLILLLVWYISPEHYLTQIICVGMGVFGALFSLLQRNSAVSLSLSDGKEYIAYQSIFISILGGMSGFTMYILIKSGIAFSFAIGNVYSIYLFSIISGFSERIVPDLFSSIKNMNEENG